MSVSPPLLFLGCNTPWVTELARELGKNRPVMAVGNRPIGQRASGPLIMEQRQDVGCFKWKEWSYPAGYAGRFEKVFSQVIARRVARTAKELEMRSGFKPLIVVPYPYILPWLSRVQDLDWIYYNLDDYRLYEPNKIAKVVLQEEELLTRARLSLCLAQTQVERLRLRAKHPNRIRHFPLGVMNHFIQQDPNYPVERSSVVYIGNMEDRVDWGFVADVARQCPKLNFYFVGRIAAKSKPRHAWELERANALTLPNVISTGPVPQKDIHLWSWKAGVNWMPYKTDHPFNIACCPTKIMDYMASGRPVLSTGVPECKLYPEFITVKDRASDAIEWLQENAGAPVISDLNLRNVQFATKNSWTRRAHEFENLLHVM